MATDSYAWRIADTMTGATEKQRQIDCPRKNTIVLSQPAKPDIRKSLAEARERSDAAGLRTPHDSSTF